jgi:hypothetical protein
MLSSASSRRQFHNVEQLDAYTLDSRKDSTDATVDFNLGKEILIFEELN